MLGAPESTSATRPCWAGGQGESPPPAAAALSTWGEARQSQPPPESVQQLIFAPAGLLWEEQLLHHRGCRISLHIQII